MKAVALIPLKPDSLYLGEVSAPGIDDLPGGRGVLVKVLRVGLCGTDSEHGGRVEQRRLWASDILVGYTDWPHLAQACRLERTVNRKGKTCHQVAYAVTSLSPQQANPRQLLTLWRGLASTGCGTSPSTKTVLRSGPRQHLKPWRPFET